MAIRIGDFDPGTGRLALILSSLDKALPPRPLLILVEPRDPLEARAEADALAAKAGSGSLEGEIIWSIGYDRASGRYTTEIRIAKVRDKQSGEVLAGGSIDLRAGYFAPGKRGSPLSATGAVAVTGRAGDGPAMVIVDGLEAGPLPCAVTVWEGSASVVVRWRDIYARSAAWSGAVMAGASIPVAVSKEAYRVWDVGPGGGFIFYDKGRPSQGWRYLEAAPKNQGTEVEWYDGDPIDIKTTDALGGGAANTAAIAAALGSSPSAASLCARARLGGLADWYLPSKKELDLLYKALRKSQPDAAGLGDGQYWSSTTRADGYPWLEVFADGEQYAYYTKITAGVRACRRF